MHQKPEIIISVLTPPDKILRASVQNPRKCVIKSGFGSMRRRCWLELYNEDLQCPVNVGSFIKVDIDGTCCFCGSVQQKRIDSIDDQLSFYAEYDPEKNKDISIGGSFVNCSVLEIFESVLQDSGLTLQCSGEPDNQLKELAFSGESLFLAIDLLCKLLGNWFWDISYEGALQIRPPSKLPDHWIDLKRDVDTVNVWETASDLYSSILVEGGIKGGSTYDREIQIPEIEEVVNSEPIRIYVRPVFRTDSFGALRRAIVQQMTRPHFEHYVDLYDRGETISPGQTARVRAEGITHFPQDVIFRVKSREIIYAHESLKTRLYLTSGFESSQTYFHFFRVDRPISRFGPFQMDLSGLDSVSPLDAVGV